MRRVGFIQLDVFTNTHFGGNQLAVFPRAEELSTEEMQAIAREMNYSESTFVVDAADPQALCRVRIFTPSTELPFAGHPVVGTTFALARTGRIREMGSPIALELGVGTLNVEVLYEERRPSFVWMRQPLPAFEPWRGNVAQLIEALGLSPADVASELPIERGSAGVPFIYVPLRSLAALGRATPGPQIAAALTTAPAGAGPFAGHAGVFLFTLEPVSDSVDDPPDVRGRMFAPELSVVEDAATGSAAGPLGAYLVRHGALRAETNGAIGAADDAGETRLRLEQGVEMGRPSRIEIVIVGDGQQIREVRVGGEAVIVAEGELFLP